MFEHSVLVIWEKRRCAEKKGDVDDLTKSSIRQIIYRRYS
jgi:hypothetical protein